MAIQGKEKKQQQNRPNSPNSLLSLLAPLYCLALADNSRMGKRFEGRVKIDPKTDHPWQQHQQQQKHISRTVTNDTSSLLTFKVSSHCVCQTPTKKSSPPLNLPYSVCLNVQAKDKQNKVEHDRNSNLGAETQTKTRMIMKRRKRRKKENPRPESKSAHSSPF